MKPDPSAVACVFPGQGSQKKRMGSEFFDRHEALCASADQILGYSIKELCLENPQGRLRFTQFTQPALYVVNALAWLDRTEREPPPAFLAGHSLGEYNALFAAGCFDFETGLRLVQCRGELMSQVKEGGMAAVLGLEAKRVAAVLEEQGAAVDLANLNLPTQIVLSGPKEALEGLIQPMKQAGAQKFLMLNVSGSFHSRYMEPMAVEFERFLKDVSFAPAQIPVIANTTAQLYTPHAVARNLVDQIRTSVRWSETMEFLLNHGVRELEELGPGKVLRKLWATATAGLALRAAPCDGSSPTVERVTGEELGDEAFRRDYGVRYAYLVGSPASGIRTAELVTTLGKAGLLGYLDSFAADPQGRARAIDQVSHRLGPGGCFGVSLRQNERQGSGLVGSLEEELVGSLEEEMVEVALHRGVRFAEAAGYGAVTPALVRFRLQGAYRDEAGKPVAAHRLLALVSRPGLASQFLKSPPQEMVASLVGKGVLTAGEGEVARHVPLASDLCAVSGTGEGADMSTLLPTILRLRDRAAVERGGSERVRVGAGGAIGTPEAVACAFLLGADFVQTSSINMCCLEAGVSTAVKELLAGLEFGDTTSAPAAEGFCLGEQVQVVKKGSLFAPRAQRLYELYRFYDSLEDIPATDREKLEKRVFKRSFDSILDSLSRERRQEVDRKDARAKMVCVFTWYLEQSFDWAMTGEVSEKINFQIPCDESMAAFNQYAEGSDLEEGTRRGVVALGERLMTDAATFLAQCGDRCGAP